MPHMESIKPRIHHPVMLKEMLDLLAPKDQEIYIDCTFGYGGYSEAILRSANCKVIALDHDSTVITRAKDLQDQFKARFKFFNQNFIYLPQVLNELTISKVDGVIMDLGVSLMQLTDVARGFSFTGDAHLDMRMNQNEGMTVAEILSHASEQELADIIYYLGDECAARVIARNIVKARNKQPITTTAQLVSVVQESKKDRSRINASTKTFQALRIFVNNELTNLKMALSQVAKLLKLNGRLIVLSFHSGEDKIVKEYLTVNRIRKAKTKFGEMSQVTGIYQVLSKKPIVPSYAEIKSNAAARSAKLRAAAKVCED